MLVSARALHYTLPFIHFCKLIYVYIVHHVSGTRTSIYVYISMNIELAGHSRKAADAMHACIQANKPVMRALPIQHLLLAAWQRGAVSHEQQAASRASIPPAASCTPHCLRPSDPGPRRLTTVPAAAPGSAATPLCAGRPRAYKSAHSRHPAHLICACRRPRP
jgi:hypothetical protein